MTRINCIDPALLSDKHLGAEYRELPRIFGLVRQAVTRGELPTDPRNPTRYTLGAGHCRFFYSRLGWLRERYVALCEECRNRGRKVSFGNSEELSLGIPPEWVGSWFPDTEAQELNIQRINERGGLR